MNFIEEVIRGIEETVKIKEVKDEVNFCQQV